MLQGLGRHCHLFGRAFAQAPAVDQTLRLAYSNPTMAFDTGREGSSPELHLLMFDGLTFYNWETHVTEPVVAFRVRVLRGCRW